MKRDPVRALSQTGIFVLFHLITISVLAFPLLWIGGSLVQITLTPFVGAAVATGLCWMIYGTTPLPDAGLRPDRAGGRDLLIGTWAGVLAVAVILVPALLLHLARFTPVAGAAHGDPQTWSFVTLLIFCGAAGEEMLFHGFAFQSLMFGLGPFATILPVGVIFGLLHMGNPDATWISTANTVGFGLLFGIAVYRTGGLWLPIGMHFGWNVAMPFFGVKLSGITMSVTGYEMTWIANPIWSGGAYGPEGGILTSCVLIPLFVLVWRYPFDRSDVFEIPIAEAGSEPGV
jgi:membrane protease YdiL (CAAX protease family)